MICVLKIKKYFEIISYSVFQCVPKVIIKVLAVFIGAAKGISFKAHEIHNPLRGGGETDLLISSIISQVDA